MKTNTNTNTKKKKHRINGNQIIAIILLIGMVLMFIASCLIYF